MLTLTPQARAVAMFSLSVLLITGSLGHVGLSLAEALTVNGSLSLKTLTVIVALVNLAFGLAVLLIASQTAVRLEPGWSHSLAQAALLLGIIGTGIAALDLITALFGDGLRPNFYLPSYG